MEMTVDNVAMIIGAKEMEIFQLRVELQRAKELLAQLTAPAPPAAEEGQDGEAAEAAEAEGSAPAADDTDQ